MSLDMSLAGVSQSAPTVLVVEDDGGLRETVHELLDMENYRVFVAGDGLDALAQVERIESLGLRLDIIVLDIMMPRMNGADFVAELERRGRRKGVAIVLLSADAMLAQRAQSLGADGFLHKPFDVCDLLDTLERLQGATPQADASALDTAAGNLYTRATVPPLPSAG